MLARSGVGAIDLVDLDDVCESNINRQVHALQSTIGQQKVAAMAERIRLIHPNCIVTGHSTFLTQRNLESLLIPEIDAVVDAIDTLRHKVALMKHCRRHKIPLIVSGGAGGRSDPNRVQVEDLARTRNDKLLQKIRKELRTHHNFPRSLTRKFGITCVYSDELASPPFDLEGNCAVQPGDSLRLDCESGYGTVGMVTAAFGITAASWILNRLAGGSRRPGAAT
jgi:tRNA threonylcarbamoyladenosine dehydratase